MAIDDKHPQYIEKLPDWQLIADCDAGERTVKAAGQTYLPPTAGMIANGFGVLEADGRTSMGQAAYDAYRTRAVFPDFVHEAIAGLAGIMHRKPPKITVPKTLEPMLKKATIRGETIETLWRKVTEYQLGPGRCGLLVDIPENRPVNESMPYIALYGALAIINWDTGQRQQGQEKVELVVLDESGQERQADYSWQFVRQFRVLTFSDQAANAEQAYQGDPGNGHYVFAVARDAQVTREGSSSGAMETRLIAGTFKAPAIASTTLDEIPWVFINPNDTTASPDRPPMLGLANLSMAIYRGEADYRQSLFMTGQDTLARIGASEEQAASVAVGAGAVIDVQMGGDIKYVGVSGVGLSEQRQCLENDRAQASAYTIQMLDASGSEEASGEALRVRVSAKTANLTTIQRTAAGGIRDALVLAGKWLGLSDAELESIEVEPNLEFSDAKAPPEAIGVIVTAKSTGMLPLSEESIHAWLLRNGYTVKPYEEEKKLLDEERTDLIDAAGAGGVDIDPQGGIKPKAEEDEDIEDDETKDDGPPAKRKPAFGGFGG